MKNIEPLVTSVEKVVAAHRAILADAETKAAAERDALAATQAADKAALEPVAQAAASLTNRLNELTSKREDLTEQIRIGRHQLTQQQVFADEWQLLVVGNFGNHHVERDPSIFRQLMAQRQHCFLSITIIPLLKKWLAEKQEALEATESAIAELAASAKAPVK